MKEKGIMERNHHGGEGKIGELCRDFSVNLNPLGMPEEAKEALLSGWNIFEKYPDDSCLMLREALAARYGMDSGRIVCGNGASDLIYRLCGCAGFQRALLGVPTFSEYERALQMYGCDTEYFVTDEENGFVMGKEQIEMISEDFDALFLCNPGNPAGGLIERGLMEEIVRRCDEKGVTLVVDECFLDFVRDGKEHSAVFAAAEGLDVVVIKAFTKIFAMAGLRLGFVLFGRRKLAQQTACFGAPWQVSGPAQAAGLAILGVDEGRRNVGTDGKRKETERTAADIDGREWNTSGVACFSCGDDFGGDIYGDFILRTAVYVENERRFLDEGLRNLGLRTVKGAANFILFHGPRGLDERMAQAGFAIRNCSDYRGLGEKTAQTATDGYDFLNGKEISEEEQQDGIYYRAAVRTSAENRLLLEEIGRCLKWL